MPLPASTYSVNVNEISLHYTNGIPTAVKKILFPWDDGMSAPLSPHAERARGAGFTGSRFAYNALKASPHMRDID